MFVGTLSSADLRADYQRQTTPWSFVMAPGARVYRKVLCKRKSLGLRSDTESTPQTSISQKTLAAESSELQLLFSAVWDASRVVQHD